ncbi:MAG TPA: DUF6599 family protein [Pyrinomonadaceae bacterium]|nr:DUF6599 family protein [Pyrinomonadaceae bacterium]
MRPSNVKDAPGTIQPKSIAGGNYTSNDGVEVRVRLLTWETDSEAYASFTALRSSRGPDLDPPTAVVGTVSTLIDVGIVFFKGKNSVLVSAQSREDRQYAVKFASLLAATLDKGEGEVPVLVQHLPTWEVAQRKAIYAVDSWGLIQSFPNQPVLKELSFDGGAEAVAANYGPSQLVIVEFTTPQISIDNDSRIWTKIAELKAQGQPVPSAYRRVGNYSVFVFNAPDEKTANALIDQVKYEQVVQWLGDDPHLYEKLQKYLTQTSAGVLIAVLKSSGLSLIVCLGIGGLIGALLFRHRRAQRAAAFSDAGGSIRLNLDELTGAANTQRLLAPPEKSHEDRSSESTLP